MATISKVAKYIREHPGRSAWSQGVSKYALDILKELRENGYKEVPSEKIALNGAKDWYQYSEGGLALIYNGDIAKRLCTKSEYKRLEKRDWGYDLLKVQGRALYQAWRRIAEVNRMVR